MIHARRIFSPILGALLLCAAPALAAPKPATAPAPKSPVPSADELAKSLKLINEVYELSMVCSDAIVQKGVLGLIFT